MPKDLYCYDDGKYILLKELAISPDNLAYGRSFGVFDFLRSQDGVILFLKDHLARFIESQKFLLGDIHFDQKKLNKIINELNERNNRDMSTFKIVLSGTLKNSRLVPHLIIINENYSAFNKSLYQNGAKLLLEEYTRVNPGYKSIYYLNTFRRYNEMQDQGAIDLLFYNKGFVTEASRSNVYMVKNGAIYTPASSILNGVVRKNILEHLSTDYQLQVQDFTLNELLNADEVFITSTLKKIMPIVRLGEHTIADGTIGNYTQAIMTSFEQLVDSYIQNYI